MDPNLDKIKNHHMDEIQQDNLEPAVRDAKDYLYRILGTKNIINISIELNEFNNHLKELNNG